MSDYDLEMSFLLDKMRRRFADVNDDANLTEADKKQLKDFYLQYMIAPESRKLLEKCFPNGVGGNSTPHLRKTGMDHRRQGMRSASPEHTPDR